MKRMISLVLVLCMMASLIACGNAPVEETKSSNTTQSTTTTTTQTTTTQPAYKTVTVQDVKNCVKEYLVSAGDTTGIVDKGTEIKDGKTTHKFMFYYSKLSASIIETDGAVEQVLCVTVPGAFVINGVSEVEALTMAVAISLLPASACHAEKNVSILFEEIMDAPSEKVDEALTYTYRKDGWLYTLFVSSSLITAAVKREAELSGTTQTTTNKTDNESAVNDDVPATTKGKTSTTKAVSTTTKATTTTKADPCADGHSWKEATCSSPATCSVCKKTSGKALEHEIYVTKCQYCEYTDFSKIAKRYTNVSAYDGTTGEDYDVHNVKINSSGVLTFTFNSKSYSLKLKQTSKTETTTDLVVFDCYINGKREPDATFFVDPTYYIPRLEWQRLDGRFLYFYAEE